MYSEGSPVGVGDTATTSLTSGGDDLLEVNGDPADMESFILSNTYTSVDFQFDYVHGAATGYVGIPLTTGESAANIAAAIAAAINGSSLGSGFDAIKATPDGGDVQLSGSIVAVDGLSGLDSRMGGRLDINPGVVVKLSVRRGSRLNWAASLSPRGRSTGRSSSLPCWTAPTAPAGRSTRPTS